MTFRLPRLPQNVALVDDKGMPTIRFQRWWQSVVEEIEGAINSANAAQMSADLASLQARVAQIDAADAIRAAGLDRPQERPDENVTLVLPQVHASDVALPLPARQELPEAQLQPPLLSVEAESWLTPPVIPAPLDDYLLLRGGTMTGAILGSAGSASAVGYGFAGDPNSGLFSPGADVVAMAIGGTETTRWNATGFAINETTFYSPFHVKGNMAAYSASATSGGSPLGAQIYLGDTNFVSSGYHNSSPGIGAVFDGSVAGSLGLYVYGGASNSRTEVARCAYVSGVPNFTVNGILRFAPGASAATNNNGDVVFTTPSNTQFCIIHKGSDGTDRSVTLTLA